MCCYDPEWKGLPSIPSHGLKVVFIEPAANHREPLTYHLLMASIFKKKVGLS